MTISPKTSAILLVDHGSRHDEANRVIESIAKRVRALAPERLVEIAHMELAMPSVAEAIDTCVDAGASEIVLQPFFLAPGRHTTHDIPRLVREACVRHPQLIVRVSAPLGPDDRLADLVLERVEASG